MNPEQADTVVIRGKRSDGLEALPQTAFIKVVTFVGLYLKIHLCVVLSLLFLMIDFACSSLVIKPCDRTGKIARMKLVAHAIKP